MKIVKLGFALACYLLGMLSILALFGFLANLALPKTVDNGQGPIDGGLVLNIVLLVGYLFVHSLMARPVFKRWWQRFVPRWLERSVYVLIAALTTFLLIYLWDPVTSVIWRVEGPLSYSLYGVYALGWMVMLFASFNIDHWEFFGISQVFRHVRQQPEKTASFTVKYLYAVMRHPISVGWLIVSWAAPMMTLGHLAFALTVTVYIAIATPLEEADLRATIGQEYRDYQTRIRAFLPFRK